MRSFTRKTTIAVFSIVLFTLAQGAHAQQTPPIKTPASVNLSALSASAPFHEVMAQYDREIATLRGVRASSDPDPQKILTENENALTNETRRAQTRMRAVDAYLLKNAPARERAITDQIRTEGDLSDAIDIAGEIHSQALRQTSEADARANDDFTLYRNDLSAQEHDDLRKYAVLLDAGTRRAYAAKKQMVRERESLFAFNLAQKESGVRSEARMRLQNLALPREERERIISTLRKLDLQDEAAIREQREKDDGILLKARALFLSDEHSAYDRMREHIKKTQANNLAERGRIANARIQETDFPKIPNDLGKMPSLSQKLQEFSASSKSSQNEREKLDAFQSASKNLATRLALLSSNDASAKNAVNEQLSLLVQQRLDLQNETNTYLLRSAQQIADRKNLGAVFPSTQAPSGSVDITADVKKNLDRIP